MTIKSQQSKECKERGSQRDVDVFLRSAFLALLSFLALIPSSAQAQPSPCNNTPIGEGITCQASTYNRSGNSSTSVSLSNGYTAGNTIIISVWELNPPLWKPNWAYSSSNPDQVIDANGNIQVVTVSGTSGATPPVWNTSGTTSDGSVQWTFVRAGRPDPDWLATDISDTAGMSWSLLSAVGSGVTDGNIVQAAMYYAVVPPNASVSDTISVANPVGTFTAMYAVMYSGLGAVDSPVYVSGSWGGPGQGDVTSGPLAVTVGDLVVSDVGSVSPLAGAGWTMRVTDIDRSLIEDQIATSPIAEVTAVLKGFDGYGTITLAFKPLAPQSFSFTPVSIPPAVQDAAYSNSVFLISGGTPPYACSTLSGSLPPGMSIAAAGAACVISGTPTSAGDFLWTAKATDSLSNTTTGTVSFVVNSSHLPVLSAVTATPVSPASAIVTWTSDMAATSQVCYQTGNAANTCTDVQDLSGVTSHSVTLTGLWPGSVYTYGVVSDGIADGVPVDYLQTTVSNTNSFTTPNASAGGPGDFEISSEGSHDTIQGSPLIGTLDIHPISGTSSFTSLKITAYFLTAQIKDGAPANIKIHWPDQQDGGAPGTIGSYLSPDSDDTLFVNSLADVQQTRFEVLPNVGGTTPPGFYILGISATWEPGDVTRGISFDYNVFTNGVGPIFWQEPQNKSANVGDNVTFSATASGVPTPSYQWQKQAPGGSFVDIPGAIANTYTLFHADVPSNGYRFQCVAQNGVGSSAVSQPAILTIASANASLVNAGFPNLKIYPNPWRSDKHAGKNILFLPLPLNSTVKIFTASGHQVKTLTPNTGTVTWDLTNDSGEKVGSGIYLYVVKDAQGNKAKGKLAVIK